MTSGIDNIIDEIKLPRMVKIRQNFPDIHIKDVEEETRKSISDFLEDKDIKGKKIAVGVGSRGITNIALIIRSMIDVLKENGAEPFIFPAMGSHGGATGEGQKAILETLGVSEKSMGVNIKSSMEVVKIGESEHGLPVYVDKIAYTESDYIILTNRIKPHTSFKGKYGSGLTKFAVIGLGKQKGAEIGHSGLVQEVPIKVEDIGKIIFEKVNILCGLGIIENPYDKTQMIVTIPGKEIMEKEPELLKIAEANMPKIMFGKINVLVVDEMGKNIAGPGMDPNIVRRNYTGNVTYEPLAEKLTVLRLTEKSHGNANGMGNADTCSRKFFDDIDFENTYPNPLTTRISTSCKIPLVMKNDKQAIQAAIRMGSEENSDKIKIIRIKNTLELTEIYISENLLEEARNNENIEVIGQAQNWEFDEEGNLDL